MEGSPAPPGQLRFARSQRSSLGIEWELQLLDAAGGDARQDADLIMERVCAGRAEQNHPHIHRELLRNTVELVSGVHTTVDDAVSDLQGTLAELRRATDELGIELGGGGAHPFARPSMQQVTEDDRYTRLIDRTRWWGRQMQIFGTHVHVGIEDRAKVLPIMRALVTRFAHLQSLAAASPFWDSEHTGYATNRAMIFQQLPTAGVPYQFDSWTDLEAYVHDMTRTGVIDSFSELRWDIRPSPALGTIEVRVCDSATNVTELRAVVALTHCLVEHYSRMLDAGRDLPQAPRWFVAENKWRSARYGMEAVLIKDESGEQEAVAETLAGMVTELEPIAADLGCLDELGLIPALLRAKAPYQRQLEVAERHGLTGVALHLAAEMRAGHPLEPEA
ncbi:glutamate--cysteine ligase [Bogoriella caseilytica]|uniref:Putative glutamate--cysteine ligase 2 n=1 Tax=Bogoriella caseilytica TaxID=56055 RepID=A0A3N2BEC0_9MICO|nr:glutamate--cysteine ligase [Bogoriella caseilytica]ROR73596.1 carboxylate-amine ligase [Bogoriella caseilytica]